MSINGKDAGDEIIKKFRVFVIAAVVIVAAYAIINALIKDMPIWIQVVLIGLLVLFVYSIRDNAKEFIKNF